MRAISVLLLLFGSLTLRAGTTSTVACVWSTITNAWEAAGDGDEIRVQAGTATIPANYVYTGGHSFTTRGAGSNLTTLSAVGITSPIWIRNSGTGRFTMSDFNWSGDDTTQIFLQIGENSPTRFRGTFRVHSIQMTNISHRAFECGSGDAFGLVDHCYFVAVPGGNFQTFSFRGNSYLSWTNGYHLGTTNQVVVEDCTSDNRTGNAGNGHFDAYDGAQFTIRRTLFIGSANNGAHGYDSQVTSTRIGEIYNNTFTNIGQATVLLDYRGGVTLWFSNSIYGTNGVTETAIRPLLKYYRGCSGQYQGTVGYAGLPLTNTFSSNWNDGDTVAAGNLPNYTFKSTLTDVNRYVKLGANLGESLSNLMAAVNLGAGSGTKYAASTTRNDDFLALSASSTKIVYTNIMDGAGAFGWPAAYQNGVLNVTRYTNSPVLFYGSYSWSNTFNGTNGGVLNFERQFDTSDCDGKNYVTNLLVLGRDYFNNTMATNYTPLVYPHPFVTADAGSGGGGDGSGSATNSQISLGGVSIGGRVSF